MELNSLFIGVALLILLAVTSLRYGVDSRDGFSTRRSDLAPRGILGEAPSVGRRPPAAVKVAETRAAPLECALEPCAA